MRYIAVVYTIRSGEDEFLCTKIVEIPPRKHEEAQIHQYFKNFYPKGRYDKHDQCFYYNGDTLALEIEHYRECSALEKTILNSFSIY